MTYKDRLSPWCIVRHLPQAQHKIVARCRRRNNAEDHLRLLKRMAPSAEYTIVYDPVAETSDETVNSN
ncbi:MAG: hypothetical protein AB1589_23305 [Cyanobacteriota bacterium]